MGDIPYESEDAGHEPAGDHQPDDAGGQPTDGEAARWEYVLVRAVAGDWDLLHFDAKYETARYPSEWFCGPGSLREAVEWIARERTADDEVDVLDRIFLLRYHDDLLYLPRSPDLAVGVPDDEKPGNLAPDQGGLARGRLQPPAAGAGWGSRA